MPDFPKTRIKFRRGTAAEFSSANPVLASGEPGFAVDTNTLKIGNGTTAWNSLSGISGGGGGYDDTYVSGVSTYASGQAIENETEIVAVSGWAESYVDSQDSAIAVSGWAGTNFLSAVSGDASPYLGGELNLDNNDIVIDCKNSTGATIYKGTPVYVSGYYSTNGKPLISVARADTASKMPAVGILNADIANDAEGTIGIMGVVSEQNTNSFTVGDTMYVAPTGGLTNVKPTGITHKIQNLGFVTRKDASKGRIVLLGAGRSNDIPTSGNFESLYVDDAPVVVSDTTGITGASGVSNIVYISSGDYAALGSYDASTIYFIR